MKLKQNHKYTTIAIYSVLVFAACLMVYKFAFNLEDITLVISSILRVMSPFILAIMIAYFISPSVNFFEKKILDKIKVGNYQIKSAKIKRIFSIIIAYFIFLGTISILLSFVIPQVGTSFSEISAKLPGYINGTLELAKNSEVTIGTDTYHLNLSSINGFIFDDSTDSIENLTARIGDLAPNIISFTTNLAKMFMNLLLGLIIAIYLLFNKESYLKSGKKTLTALLPLDKIDGFFELTEESHKIFSGFFVGKLIDSLIIGLICFIAMIILKIPYALLISVIVGITNMIPYFGPFIGGGIGIIFLLIGTPIKAIWFAILIIVLQQFDGNILGPKILGDSTGLKPFWVIFAIISFGGMFGLMGMFIGVPCFAVLKNIFDNIIDHRYQERLIKLERESISIMFDEE